jgi:hypothetical protein
MNAFTLMKNIEKYSYVSAVDKYNTIVRSIRNLLRGTTSAIDSTIIETNPDFPGCGKTKRKKESCNSNSPEYEYIYGFKLFILYEVKSRIITAISIVPANVSDHNYFLPLIKQGIKNCGKKQIQTVIADRGFLDGASLWELKYTLGIDFVIPAKAGMIVREDAIALWNNHQVVSEWMYGKGICKGYGVNYLTSYLDYNRKKMKNNRNTNGSPINAVVVTHWRDKSVSPDKQVVLLTSLPAEGRADKIAKIYRLRSLIENCGFRELKQASFLKKLPRRKGEFAENAAYLHILFCVIAHTLFYAFLIWRKNEYIYDPIPVCMRNWRRNELTDCSNKILIIAQEKYFAFYDVGELLTLFGVKQKYTVKMSC